MKRETFNEIVACIVEEVMRGKVFVGYAKTLPKALRNHLRGYPRLKVTEEDKVEILKAARAEVRMMNKDLRDGYMVVAGSGFLLRRR